MELICLGFLGNLMTMQPVDHQDPTFTLDIILKLLFENKLNIAEKIDNYITGFDLKKGEKIYNCATAFENTYKNSR